MNIPFPKEDFSPIHSLITRSVSTQVMREAVEVKLFDELEIKPCSLEMLAAHFGFVESKLSAILDLLDAYGLVSKNDGVYSNTPLASEYLVTNAPLYQGLAMKLTMGFCDGVNSRMDELLKQDGQERGSTDKKWSAADAMEGTAQESVGGGLQKAVESVCNLPEFEKFKLMADLGGNHGNYTMSILSRNPEMKGIILDLPHVVKISEERCSRMGYGERVEGVALDMREDELPLKNFDLLFASHVLYACQENIQPLLHKIANSLRPGGWLASHHYARTGSALSRETIASLEVITKLSGYFSHFIEPEFLEQELAACGFGNFKRYETDSAKGIMLVLAQKL